MSSTFGTPIPPRFPINWEEFRAHLRAVRGANYDGTVTVQTLGNRPEDKRAADKERWNARWFCEKGHIDDPNFRRAIQRRQDLNAGVYLTTNETLGGYKQRGNDDVTRITNIALDGDFEKAGYLASLRLFERVSGLVPTVRIRTNAGGNEHLWYQIFDHPLNVESYKNTLGETTARAGLDHLISPAGLLRAAGGWHCKAQPFQSRIIELNRGHGYTLAEFTGRMMRVTPVRAVGDPKNDVVTTRRTLVAVAGTPAATGGELPGVLSSVFAAESVHRALPDANAAAMRSGYTPDIVAAAISSIPDGCPDHPLGSMAAWWKTLFFPLIDFAVRNPEFETQTKEIFSQHTRRLADPVRSRQFWRHSGILRASRPRLRQRAHQGEGGAA